jgi:hypothetical protein
VESQAPPGGASRTPADGSLMPTGAEPHLSRVSVSPPSLPALCWPLIWCRRICYDAIASLVTNVHHVWPNGGGALIPEISGTPCGVGCPNPRLDVPRSDCYQTNTRSYRPLSFRSHGHHLRHRIGQGHHLRHRQLGSPTSLTAFGGTAGGLPL